jgi:protein arginine N-methyltransferase 1
MSLTPKIVLRRIPELSVHVSAAGDVTTSTAAGTVSCGPHGLAILDLFAEPTTFADAVDVLGARVQGAQDWIDLTAAITRLYDNGILVVEGRPEGTSVTAVRGSFDSPGPHVAMLEDRVRTTAFLSALNEGVGPADVVVDIGTGTGILAAGAARAGARHVYAVEATPIARHARAVFDANDFADRVTLVEGWSTRITLPERADVVVAEVLGSEALEERALHVLLDARRRHLKPGGRLVPSAIRIFGVPVDVPEEALGQATFTRANTQRWSAWYGLDLEPLASYSERLIHRLTVPIDDVRSWQPLSDPVLLAELPLDELDTPAVDAVARANASSVGDANGAYAFFEAQLSAGVVVTTNPSVDPAVTSWGLPVWLFPESMPLCPGKDFGFEYSFRDGAGKLRLTP